MTHSLTVIAGRVLLPFAGGYFLSYLYRSVNAVIAPNLERDFNIGAADLGTLTAAYFIAFSGFQIPLGILLDRFGPRRVQALLLLSAALGAVVFALGGGLLELALGRVLIGLGVAGGLMSAMKAISLWLPKDRWALANGLFMAAGGLGALAATLPAEMLLRVLPSWQGLFWILAGLTCLVSAAIHFTVPESPGTAPSPKPIAAQLKECWGFIRDPRFWRFAPVAMVGMPVGMAIQGLWAAPYLRDIGGLQRIEVAETLFALGLALTAGFVLTGLVADWLQRAGIPMRVTLAASIALYIVNLLLLAFGIGPTSLLNWIAFGLLCNTTALAYPMLSGQFPVEAVGRVTTLLNAVVFGCAFFAQAGLGWIIALWPRDAAGHYPLEAYSAAFGGGALLLAAALAWYLKPLAADQAKTEAGSGNPARAK